MEISHQAPILLDSMHQSFISYCQFTPVSNLGNLPPQGQFFMGAKLFIGAPGMRSEGALKTIGILPYF